MPAFCLGQTRLLTRNPTHTLNTRLGGSSERKRRAVAGWAWLPVAIGTQDGRALVIRSASYCGVDWTSSRRAGLIHAMGCNVKLV